MAKKINISEKPDLTKKVTMQLLGEAVKACRTRSNLKLTDAASLCGVSKQTMNNIEKGYETTKVKSILKVCENLGLELYLKDLNEGDGDWWK